MKKIITTLTTLFCLLYFNTNSQTWLSLSSGLGSSTQSVKAIAVDPLGNIYAGGTFTGTCNYLAMWNGISWTDLGSGFNGPVYSIAVNSTSDIYIGGSFSTAGGINANNIVRYSGGNWSAVDSGFNGQVNCIYITGTDDVYAGGQFTLSGNSSMNHIAKFSGSEWASLGSGINGVVNSIVINNSVLYAGTEIITGPVQKFSSNSWSAVSGISNGKVYTLASFKNYLYAGGDFQLPYYAAAKWDGSNWSSITTVFSPSHKVYSFFNRKDSVLYIGGNFTGVGVGSPNYIGKIDGVINSPVKKFTVSSDLDGGEVYAIGNVNGKVIACGKFTSPASNIAITSTTVGINEASTLILENNFYPNPVIETATLKVTTSEPVMDPVLEIYDVQLRLIKNVLAHKEIRSNEIEFSIDCNALKSGNYYYSLKVNNKTYLSDKFVISRD